MADPETQAVYAAMAGEYRDLVTKSAPDGDLRAFIDGIAPGGRVLDLGCGPGNSAAAMAAAGLRTEAWDASPQMIELAAAYPGIESRVAGFDALTAQSVYAGIWANFSLLHAPRAEMPGHLARISAALEPGGLFHIGMKLGTGASRDRLGRYYTYYDKDELLSLLTEAGLIPGDTREGEGAGLSGEVSRYVIVRARRGA